MSLAIKHDEIPLSTTRDGVVVVGGTRVSLDVVVAAFTSGATPEEIAQQYPSIPLADVYAAIIYYLRHHDEVTAYLEDRRRQGDEVRDENERRFDPEGIRARVMARSSTPT